MQRESVIASIMWHLVPVGSQPLAALDDLTSVCPPLCGGCALVVWQALQGLSSTPLDELGEEVVDLADVVLVPSRCALHRHHWMVYQALLLLATTAQTRLQGTPRSGPSQPQ